MQRYVTSLLPLSILLAGCGAGAPAEAIRPNAPTGSQALNEAECHGVDQGGEPLIVDWKPEQRGDLEVAMKEGIAIVSYSCEGIKLLPDCKLDGDYGYIGMTRREQVVRLSNGDEVRANLPLSGASISGGLERGTTLDIAMMIVGKKRTTWDAPSIKDLKGKCDGATHFVRGATVGAFAMESGSAAKVRAAAEIFGAGAAAGSNSSKETQNRDGDVSDCQKATPDSEKAPPQCGAPIRLVLAPLAKGDAAPAQAAPQEAKVESTEKSACPEGLVFADGKCTKPEAAKSYECKPSDPADCKTQCDKGNAASCGILAEQKASARDWAAASDLMKKACDGGHARSCAVLGRMTATGVAGKPDLAAAIPLFQKSCDAADALGCRELGRGYLAGDAPLAKDETKASGLFRQACDGGDNQGCSLLAGMVQEGKGVAKDPVKSAQLYKRACDGGLLSACASAGRAYASGVMKNEILAQIIYQRGCIRLDAASCTGLARLELVQRPDDAKRHFEQACNSRDTLACAALKVLYGGNRPVFPDMMQLGQLESSCRMGDTFDCTSAGLLEAARGNAPLAKTSLQSACTRMDKVACEVLKKVP